MIPGTRAAPHLKRLYRAGWAFFTILKSNRLVCLGKESGYRGLGTRESPPQGWSQGEEVRLKEASFREALFTRVTTNGGIEQFVTNYLAAHLTCEPVIRAVQVRWQVAAFHRSFKHLAGWENARAGGPRRSATTGRVAARSGSRPANTPAEWGKVSVRRTNSNERPTCGICSKNHSSKYLCN